MGQLPTIRRVKQENIPSLVQAAVDDGSLINAIPTHEIRKNGEQVGYWSVAPLPLVLAWHKKSLSARDSMHLFESFDIIASDRGISQYIVPLEPDSPYNEYMEKLGFKELGSAKLYIKDI